MNCSIRKANSIDRGLNQGLCLVASSKLVIFQLSYGYWRYYLKAGCMP